MSFVVVIPARYASSRLPGKPLLDIAGKPMIQHVVESANNSGAQQVVVATDDERIKLAVEAFGGTVCMTSSRHESGSDRLAEVCQKMGWSKDVLIVNVQGDEPLLPAVLIKQVAQLLLDDLNCEMATLSVPLSLDELSNPNAVKVVADNKGYALYFSRAPIPFDRDADIAKKLEPQEQRHSSEMQALLDTYQRHLGLYAYRVGFLQRYVNWPAAPLERIERLEQLRVLWQGEKICITQAKVTPPAGIDTAEDLQRVRAEMGK